MAQAMNATANSAKAEIFSVRCQRASHDQRRKRGDRQAHLLHQHVREYQREAILRD